jgi:crotonobetaine/carnitine-CoA ligase
MSAHPIEESPWGPSDDAIGLLLRGRAKRDGDFVYCRQASGELTITELERLSNKIANALEARGIGPGSRVATMLGNSVEHICLFFALAKRGACQIPINIHLRGDGLAYILRSCECDCLIAEADLSETLQPILAELPLANLIWRGTDHAGTDFSSLINHQDETAHPVAIDPDAVIYICYTSGTTGLPKGVMLTDRMLRVAAWTAGRAGAPQDGDVYHLWTPFYHIGGCEILILGLQRRVTLALVPKFSVSRFWDEVREFKATHMQFLGGVLALLLKQPASPGDRDHGLRAAFGGGCPEAIWRAFEERFGVPIRECYGLTECSSFATQNLKGKVGSVGKPLPWLDITLVDDEGREVAPGERGEIWIRERVPGVLTKGYWRNPEATAATLVNGTLRTGDLARCDADGDFIYLGRKKDSLRRRGENIAAFEVERILNQHPDVDESAVIGVPNEIQDEDIKAVLRLREDSHLDPLDLIKWCEGRMAYFQMPRFISFVQEFPRTPSQRIRKEALSRDISDCWDLDKSGHVLRR